MGERGADGDVVHLHGGRHGAPVLNGEGTWATHETTRKRPCPQVGLTFGRGGVELISSKVLHVELISSKITIAARKVERAAAMWFVYMCGVEQLE